LLLLVWGSFSDSVRKELLLKCVAAVNKVAEEKESGYVVPPLTCCRLLLVLQYMVFRFNEPVQQLVQQVDCNLLSDLLVSPLISDHADIMSFPCDQEYQYQQSINKPPVPLLTPVAAATPTGTTPTVDDNKKKKNDNMRTVLILEGDIDFQPDFKSNLKRTLQEVNSHDPDWDLVYVGRKELSPNVESIIPGTKNL
uniref:E3 ubiquitin-protein ligase UBR4 N-terminal domain-containing protein n=1 Tax=Amphimedon queenslandica TaxID=400682 RepID=A0A1X7T501_AMPQE